jgi:ABC-2 type transport system permease protein
VLALSLFFTKIHLYHPIVTLSTFVLAATIFALLGFVNAIYARKFDDIAIIPTFILTPLTYLGGVFYNVSQLPSPWKELSHANPILYMVNAFRYGVLGISDVHVGMAFVVMIGFVIALSIVALQLLKRGVGLRS